VLYYLAGDHLGTTSLVLNANGTVHSEARHYPYGEERWRWPQEGTFPTEYRFTGQRNDSYIKLVHMGARHYDPALARWLSADTLVPEPGSPQSFNRYAYVGNRPLNYTDPSGHVSCGAACPGDWTNWEFNPDAAYQGSYEPRQQAANRARAEQAFSLLVDFAPGAGDAKGFVEVFTGKDLVTGESLGGWRWLGVFWPVRASAAQICRRGNRDNQSCIPC
jgi:RHS repeat-associated protein